MSELVMVDRRLLAEIEEMMGSVSGKQIAPGRLISDTDWSSLRTAHLRLMRLLAMSRPPSVLPSRLPLARLPVRTACREVAAESYWQANPHGASVVARAAFDYAFVQGFDTAYVAMREPLTGALDGCADPEAAEIPAP